MSPLRKQTADQNYAIIGRPEVYFRILLFLYAPCLPKLSKKYTFDPEEVSF